jgi:hypothetical protein
VERPLTRESSHIERVEKGLEPAGRFNPLTLTRPSFHLAC